MSPSKPAIYLALAFTTTSLYAQNCVPDPGKSLSAIFADCSGNVTAAAEETTKETVTEMATSAAAPEGFAERVNDTIADFLPIFQFAVNGVTTSDDKKSVVVKFNPPIILHGRTSLKATVSEPHLFSKFEDEIVEGAREAQSKQLLGEAGDFSDITYSLDWGLRLNAGNWSTTRHIFGREFETYEGLVDELADASINRFGQQIGTPSFAKAQEELFQSLDSAASTFGISVQNFSNTNTYGQLIALIEQEPNPAAKQAKRNALEAVLLAIRRLAKQESLARLKVSNLDAIDSLIANQPEFLIKAAYRDSKEVVGQREATYTLSYEMGASNFNRVFREYNKLLKQRPAAAGPLTPQEDDAFKVQAYDKVVNDLSAEAQHRFAFSGIYKKIYDYDFQHSYEVQTVNPSGTPVTTMQDAELKIPSSAEWHLKVLYSKPVRSFLGGPASNGDDSFSPNAILPSEKRARLDFSLEGIWVDEDQSIAEALQRKDRVVGRLTFTQPLANGMSFPISIVYANRAEFLKDEKDILSAHVAISYKLIKASDRPEQ